MAQKDPRADTGKAAKGDTMVVEISEVSGKVVVRKGQAEPYDARPGMKFTGRIDLLVATAENAKAVLLVNGDAVSLGAKSLFTIRNGVKSRKVHGVPWSETAKKWIGKIWSKVPGAGGGEEAPTGNAAIGVRG